MAARARNPFQLASQMLPADAFFWYAEAASPEVRPLVAGLFLLDRPPRPKPFRRSMVRLVSQVHRLRQRVVESALPLGLPRWEEDPLFELDYHVRSVALPPPATERSLLTFASSVFATPLDHLRPLWEAYLVTGLANGGAALFLKLHHSVMDGVGAIALFDAMTQARRGDRIAIPRPPQSVVAPKSGLPSRALEVAASAATLLAGVSRAGVRAIASPGPAIEEVARGVNRIRGLLRDIAAPSAANPLTARSSGIGRRLAMTTFSLPRLLRVKNALGVPLNDLVLAAVAGALGRYYNHCGRPIDAVQCMVPMSLRRQHESHTLGNRVGAFNIRLPVGERDALVRLREIRDQTGTAKSNRQGVLYHSLMQTVSVIPAAVFRLVAQNASGRVQLICSNVPGPTMRRYLAGSAIIGAHPFAPVMLGTALSIALLSYGDSYCVGIDADPGVMPDPDRLRRYLEAAMTEMERRALPTRRGGKRRSRIAKRPTRAAPTTLSQLAARRSPV